MNSTNSIGTLIFLFICSVGFSQINRVVKLRNGSEIRGEILPSPDNSIKLKTRDGSIWVFQAQEIDTIFQHKTAYFTSHFYNRTTVGGLSGQQAAFSAQVVNGYRINEHFHLGFGVGSERYDWSRYYSLYGDFQCNLLKGPTTPFLVLNGGLVKPFQVSNVNKGGFSLGTSIGFSHFFSRNVGIMTTMGYRFSQLEYSNNWWEDFKTFHKYNQFEIRFGLIFK